MIHRRVAADATKPARHYVHAVVGGGLVSCVFPRNLADFTVIDHAFAEAFGPARPARTTVPCTGFRAGLEVEIDLIAAVRSEQGG